jgi:hypothetical protein
MKGFPHTKPHVRRASCAMTFPHRPGVLTYATLR